MALKAKTFLVRKGVGLDEVENFILSNIGRDGELIHTLTASALNDDVTQLTLIYDTRPEAPFQDISPREGGIFGTNVVNHAQILFSYPFDPDSIETGTFLVDSEQIDPVYVKVDPTGNNYLVQLELTGYQGDGYHEIRMDHSKILKDDGTNYDYSPVAGYTIHSLASAHLGEPFPGTDKRRGDVKISRVPLSKGANPQIAIDDFLSNQGISSVNLIAYATASRAADLIDVYFIYYSTLEPRIVEGFPLAHTLFPDIAAPGKLTLVFGEPIDRDQLLTETGIFHVYTGFDSYTGVDTSEITVLTGDRTVQIDTSNIFTNRSVYNLVVNPGILSQGGDAILEKPFLWSVVSDTYTGLTGDPAVGGGGVTDHTQLTNIGSTPHAQIDLELTGLTGASGVAADHRGDSTIHFTVGSISHTAIGDRGDTPHTEIDDQLTGLTGFSGSAQDHIDTTNIHFTEGSIDHTNITNIGDTTHGQIDIELTGLTGFSGTAQSHIDDSTLHYTVGSIDHGSIAGLGDDDHSIYIKADGTRAFTDVVVGVAPTADLHLSTKKYVDDSAATAGLTGVSTGVAFHEHDGDTDSIVKAAYDNLYIGVDGSDNLTVKDSSLTTGHMAVPWSEIFITGDVTPNVPLQGRRINITGRSGVLVEFDPSARGMGETIDSTLVVKGDIIGQFEDMHTGWDNLVPIPLSSFDTLVYIGEPEASQFSLPIGWYNYPLITAENFGDSSHGPMSGRSGWTGMFEDIGTVESLSDVDYSDSSPVQGSVFTYEPSAWHAANFASYNGITYNYDPTVNEHSVSGNDASTTAVGVAKFSGEHFSVVNEHVMITGVSPGTSGTINTFHVVGADLGAGVQYVALIDDVDIMTALIGTPRKTKLGKVAVSVLNLDTTPPGNDSWYLKFYKDLAEVSSLSFDVSTAEGFDVTVKDWSTGVEIDTGNFYSMDCTGAAVEGVVFKVTWEMIHIP